MNAGTRAVSMFEIEDVFLVETKCSVARDLNQTAKLAEYTFAHQMAVDSECLWQTRTPVNGGEPFYVLRYFVNADVRLLKPEFRPGGEGPTDEDSIAVLKFTIAVDYRCPKEAQDDAESVGAFTRNACFHAWPYVRAEVHSACDRLRIPRLTLPMLKVDQKPSVEPPAPAVAE